MIKNILHIRSQFPDPKRAWPWDTTLRITVWDIKVISGHLDAPLFWLFQPGMRDTDEIQHTDGSDFMPGTTSAGPGIPLQSCAYETGIRITEYRGVQHTQT